MFRRYAVLLSLLFLLPSTRAAVVYVNQAAPGPTHDGTSWSTAFQKVQEGINAAQVGDEVWVARGTYYENLVAKTGTSLLGGFGGSETRNDQRNYRANVTLLDGMSKDPVIRGKGAAIDGFVLRNGLHSIIYQSGGRIENNVITGDYPGGGWLNGIWTTGIGAVISNNIITGNTLGILADEPAVIRDNVIARNHHGIDLDWRAEVQLTGNTLVENWGTTVTVHNGTLTLVANNIFAFNGRIPEVGTALPEARRNNCYFENGSGSPTFEVGSNVFADPRFRNRAGGDYHLLPDSPCIDAGDNSVVQAGEVDIDRQPRIFGERVDIGADEFVENAFFMDEALLALRIAGGLHPSTLRERHRLDVAGTSGTVNLRDAVRVLRRAMGVDPNP